MKDFFKSRFLFIVASMSIFAAIMKVVVNLDDLFPISFTNRWADAMVIDLASIWYVVKSDIKNKVLMFFFGCGIFTSIVVILACLSLVGIVERV